ncbi:MAG: saccharopine dehydrogenase NADP-binding domain-containing protein [Chloroflexota bacterium]
MSKWLLYGATGYTGRLIAEHAVKQGHRPTLSGRNPEKLSKLAAELDLDWIACELDNAVKLLGLLKSHDLVLHAAGPFIHTAHPMIKACIAAKTHYLDITGEIDVFEYTFSHYHEAYSAGIVLMSGVGFDVIPTDCMAKYVSDLLPSATDLKLAFHTVGGMSPGTSKTMVESAGIGGAHRKNSIIESIPIGTGEADIQFSHKKLSAIPIPWGDLVTAFHTTGIPNITTYFSMPPNQIKKLKQFGWMANIVKLSPMKQLAQGYIERHVTGPDKQTRETGKSYIWAKASDPSGNTAEAWLETMEAYKLTALGSIRCVERVLDSDLRGAYTPAGAFGAELVLDLPGSKRYDEIPH